MSKDCPEQHTTVGLGEEHVEEDEVEGDFATTGAYVGFAVGALATAGGSSVTEYPLEDKDDARAPTVLLRAVETADTWTVVGIAIV